MKRVIATVVLLVALDVVAGAAGRAAAKSGQFYVSANYLTGTFAEYWPVGAWPTGVDVASFSDSTGVSGTQVSFSVDFDAGYFLFDGFGVGISTLGLFSYANDNVGTNTVMYTVGPGIEALYILDLGGFVSPYAKVTGNYLLLNSFSGGIWNTETSGFIVMPTVGAKLFVAPSASIDIAGFYHYTYTTQGSAWYKCSSFGLQVGISAYF